MKIEEYESLINGIFVHDTDAAKEIVQFASNLLEALLDDDEAEAYRVDVTRAANMLYMLNLEIKNGHLDIVKAADGVKPE